MQHNRYLIYEMIGKHVSFKLPKRFGNDDVTGLVKDVTRDVLTHEIRIEIDKQPTYVFREPTSIVAISPDNIVMVYGDFIPNTDEEFFEENIKATLRGFGADEAFRSMEKESMLVSFLLSEPIRKNRRTGSRTKKTKKRKKDRE